jgi:hypothetical protein
MPNGNPNPTPTGPPNPPSPPPAVDPNQTVKPQEPNTNLHRPVTPTVG